jgi:hypothetical protein
MRRRPATGSDERFEHGVFAVRLITDGEKAVDVADDGDAAACGGGFDCWGVGHGDLGDSFVDFPPAKAGRTDV